MQPTSSLAAHDACCAAGLFSAAAHCLAEDQPVMLVCHDQPYPQPLDRVRTLTSTFATAMVLTPEQTPLSRLHLELNTGGDEPPSPMPQPQLEALRRGNPAARALPVLALMAAPGDLRLTLPYLPDCGLILVCRAC
jgi:hypothetical protein